MKFITLFFVLSLVVLMAEPGEGFFHHIISGIIHGKMEINECKNDINQTEHQQENLDDVFSLNTS
uniref:Uncharacterized protein n=1 Tax=Mastacembelus armatus TaxID=205130 RepID=A0A3Q3N4Y7_9TELE